MRVLSFILLLTLSFAGCNQERMIRIEGLSYRHDNFHKQFDYNVKITTNKNIKTFEVNDVSNPPETVTYTFKQFLDNKDSVIFEHISCQLLESKEITAGGKTVIIYKYRYDDINGEDEEMDLFVTEGNGLIAFKSLAWDSYELFINGDKSLTKELRKDSTTFFMRNYKYQYL